MNHLAGIVDPAAGRHALAMSVFGTALGLFLADTVGRDRGSWRAGPQAVCESREYDRTGEGSSLPSCCRKRVARTALTPQDLPMTTTFRFLPLTSTVRPVRVQQQLGRPRRPTLAHS